jgi:hypothetical protein
MVATQYQRFNALKNKYTLPPFCLSLNAFKIHQENKKTAVKRANQGHAHPLPPGT